MALVGPALAKNATLVLSGTVPVRSSMRVAPAEFLPSFDPARRLSNAPLARFINDSNSSAGFSITLVSENAQRHGQPVLTAEDENGTGGSVAVPYQLTYDDQPLQFDNAQATVSGGEGGRSLRGVIQDLRISTDAAATRQAQLSDTLHFIVRAN